LFGKVAPSPSPSAQSPPVQEPAGTLTRNVDQHLVSILAPSSFEAEQYRVLRHMLKGRRKLDACTTIVVSSAIPGDGKTTTVINLAAALAQDPNTRVLLADADIRRPSVSKYLGLDDASGTGLVDLVQNQALELKKVVRFRTGLNFSILQAGTQPKAPHEVLNSPRLGLVLEEARRHYDYIVLDSPPVVPVPDCRILAKLVDGILLVVAAHKTPRPLLAEAMDAMEPEKLIGLVFNSDDRPLGGYGYYQGYYSPYVQPRKP
jgi:capsular exopolysaccharide synthesis family protein